MADLNINIMSQCPDSLSGDKLQQVKVLLGVIAAEAVILESLLNEHSEQITNEAHFALNTVAQKIGYLADLGSSQTGGIQVQGGAEDWFLPPSYHFAEETMSGQRDEVEA